MNILYIHGFDSSVKAQSPKYDALAELGKVTAIAPDYAEGRAAAVELATRTVKELDIDLLVGTSMGGWLAAQIGEQEGLPFVALNPSIEPHLTLDKYVGKDLQGKLSHEAVSSYGPFPVKGRGMVIVELGDEVIDSRRTVETLSPHFPVIQFSGGAHQFEKVDEIVAPIREFLSKKSAI
ncbi:YqiA/YcfP family alpha/beta fold hydrolase [Marinobacter zhanjiangensis]|uniref:Esterase n=1 Tax=Marinobacter zhanjiangensis TaxID=578215 RepID=A0ABQ3AT91_9GAMM|nr:YqiA/YcfP family alpha/beta fold hydrolase [Marinobacter zhanjiangensis]GGY63290.1 esterase [Marinobacter zhanjiangensis]